MRKYHDDIVKHTISSKKIVVRGRKWYKRSTWNFDMALDLDKYTSWCNPCIDVIIDLDFYISTSWIKSLYINCEHEVPMTICTMQMNSGWIYYMPIHLPRLLMMIVNNCSWSNNLCIIAVDKWSIEIYIVQKTIPLIGMYIKMIIIEILELWTSF